jgi:polysaccharide export outer membrane protein
MRIAGVVALAGVLLAGTSGLHAEEPLQPAPPTSTDYLIGIEDRLQIFVWGETDLSLQVQVRPDGKITVPLVNDIVVVGLTSERVRDKIAEALAKYIREPLVTVIVEEINSYRVYFLGEINQQGVIQFYRPTTLLQGIAAAGGLTEFAKKEITLIRVESGVEKRVRIDYKRLASGDPSQQNVYLQAGDTLLFN